LTVIATATVIITVSPWYRQFSDIEGKREFKKATTITKRTSSFWNLNVIHLK